MTIRHLIDLPDLGDITGVKVGDKLATLRVERGRLVVDGLRPVTAVDDVAVWCKRDKFLKVQPWGFYFMSKRVTPDWYYSANPLHVAEAERKTWEARTERERVEREASARRAAVADLGALLGDGERYTETYGEPYLDTPVADVLAERLTVEQIETLKSWLGVK